MEIEYVTHASLLLRGDRVQLLTDPFFFPERDEMLAPSVRLFPPRPIDAAQFGHLDYVFSSHEHHDHCHPQTLVALRPYVGTVLLPAERPALEQRYRDAGYSDIVLLKNSEPLTLRDNLEVCCVWDGPVDTQLRVTLDGVSVIHGNDCRLNMPAVWRLSRMGPIDFAFLCSTSTQELYPLLLGRSFEETGPLAQQREDTFFAEQVRTLAALKPKVVVPYSYTTAYIEEPLWKHNVCGRLTPPLYQRALAAALPAQECWVIEPGDVIDAATREVRRFRPQSLWGTTLDEHLRHLEEWICSQPPFPRFDAGNADAVAAPLDAWLAARQPHLSRPLFAWAGGAVTLRVEGETSTREVRVAHKPDAEPGLRITLPATLVKTMLDGRYDPFMALYTYKVAFDFSEALKRALSPEQDYVLRLGLFLSLFIDERSPLNPDVRSLEETLGPPTE